MWRSRGVAAVTAPNDPAAAAAAGLQARPASKKSSSTQTAGCSGAGDGGCDIAAWGHRRRRVRGVPSWRTALLWRSSSRARLPSEISVSVFSMRRSVGRQDDDLPNFGIVALKCTAAGIEPTTFGLQRPDHYH